MTSQPLTTCLWFDDQAEEAARFYTGVFKDARMGEIHRYTEAGPGPAGTAMLVEFELNGQNFIPSATASGKVALIIYGATANELTWETTPKTKLLGTIPMAGGTKLVLQLDDPAQVSSLQVTVHKKGEAETQTTSVAVVRP